MARLFKRSSQLWTPQGMLLAGVPVADLDYRQVTVVTTGLSLLAIGGNRKRVALGFNLAVSAGTVLLRPRQSVANQGFLIPSSGELLWLMLNMHGPMIWDDWFATGMAGTSLVSTEVYAFR